jgi:hypothetical protein
MAGINKYDQPISGQAYDTFVDTYVPIPFDEMMKVGMMKKEQEDKAYDALSKTYEDTYNLKYIPNSEDEKYIKGTVIPGVRDVFNKYANQELSNPIIQRQMRAELNSKIDKNRISGTQTSYEGWKEYRKNYDKLKLEGKASPFETDESEGWDTNKHGEFTKAPEAYTDPIKELQERLFAPIHDSTLKKVNLGEGNISVTSGVDQTTIDTVTKDNLGSYLNTTTGKNAIKAMRASTGIGPDKKTDAEMLAYAIQKAGDPYLRHNEKIEHLQRPRVDKNKTIPGFNDMWSNTQSIKNVDRVNISKDQLGHTLSEANDPIKLMKSGSFDSNGNLKLRDDVYKPLDIHKPASSPMSPYDYHQEKDPIKAQQQYNTQKSIIDHIRQTSPEMKDVSDMEVLRSYAQAYNNAENVDYNEYLFDNMGKGNIKKPITDMVIDDLGGRKLVSAQTGKHSGETINNINDIFDKLKVPKNDRKRSNIHITGTVPGRNAYKATVFAADGPHDFLISTNQKEQYIFKPMEDATKLANNGIIGDKELNVGGRRLIVRTKMIPDIDNNGQPTHKFKSVVASGDGQSILRGQDPNAEIPLNVLEWESVQQLTHPYTQQALNNAGQQEQTDSADSEE